LDGNLELWGEGSVNTFTYTPDEEQKIHSAGAISLICKAFQTHENGIPEWAKNAADAYGREGSPQERRVILICLCDRKDYGPPSIACLDFVGTTSERIEKYFRIWASPDAAAQDTAFKTQGGHGNGGKCYMTQMFNGFSVFHTVRGKKACMYGVKGGSAIFGYAPSKAKGRDRRVSDRRAELNEALTPLALTLDKMPEAARKAFEMGEGFTLVRGVGPKYFEKKIRAADLLEQVRDHAQMLTTLEYCDVYVMYNGKLMSEANPLKPSMIEPIKGAEEPRVVEIPETLVDPVDESEVSTTQNGKYRSGSLVLRTASKSMRWKRKTRHTINYKAQSGFIGYKSMLEFPVQSSYQDKIYGECELDALENFKQNDRAKLAESPLTRVVECFIAEKVEEYAQEFEKLDKKDYSKRERNALSQMNQALDRWKNQFIRNMLNTAFGSGVGPREGGRSLPAGKPSRIEVTTAFQRAGIGVPIRPTIRFYDSRSQQIRPVPFRWVSEDWNVALVDEDLMLINTFAPGETFIYAETIEGEMKSNRVPLSVIRIRSVQVQPPAVEVREGSRTQMRAQCSMWGGEASDDIALIWTEGNASVARVNATGMVYGASQGQTEIYAGDDNVMSGPATVTVREDSGDGEKGEGRKPGRKPGRGYPVILVSGEVDRDPETDEYVYFSGDDPPVCQRPRDADRNIWWINSAAPLARLFLDKDQDYGYESREWRMYHLERYIEVITQISLLYDPENQREKLTVSDFFLQTGGKSAEIQAAVAEELGSFIKDGIVPEV